MTKTRYRKVAGFLFVSSYRRREIPASAGNDIYYFFLATRK